MDPSPSRTGGLSAVAISGSPSPASKSRQLLDHAVRRLAQNGVPATVVCLAELPADELLGRSTGERTTAALAAVDSAQVLLVATPVYRAAYSGLLKVFFDLLQPNALHGKVAVAIATGGGPAHQLVLDHALRPLLQSVGALVVTTGVYATDGQFGAEGPQPALVERIDHAIDEALAHARVSSAAAQPAGATSTSR